MCDPFDEVKLETAYVATSWETHVRVSIDAFMLEGVISAKEISINMLDNSEILTGKNSKNGVFILQPLETLCFIQSVK